MRSAADRRSCDVALEGRLGEAYNEEAFRYLLEIERKRAERSGLPILLLLVGLKEDAGVRVGIDSEVALKLFSELWLCLRETDFVGWYRDGRVAGAVLTQPASGSPPEVSSLVRQRVTEGLREALPADVVQRLKVRVHFLRPRPKT